MTAAVLPLLAAAALDAILVARPRTAVVHVARPSRRGLTPGGRLRRGTGPLCGTRGRAWTACTDPARRLCRRCATHPSLRALDPSSAAVTAALTEQQLTDLLDQAITARDLHLAVLALTSSTVPGALFRLSPRVRDARHRIHPQPTRHYPSRRRTA